MFPKIEFEFDNSCFYMKPGFNKAKFIERKVIYINWLWFIIYFIWEK